MWYYAVGKSFKTFMHRYYFLNIKANIIVNSAYSAVKFIAFQY